MPNIIKNGQVIADDFQFCQPDENNVLALPSANVLVSLKTWQAFRDVLLAHPHQKGVQLAPDEFAESISDDLKVVDLIAIEFLAFADGRGYSTAYLLRSRYHYTGELRAVGDVFKDTLFYQHRCGFNSFAVRADKDINDALLALQTFSAPYQGSATEPAPLFQRRHA